MKYVSSILAVAGLFYLASGTPLNETSLERRCCSPGCYSVKIETHVATNCDDTPAAASIANWGDKGACIDTYNGHNWLLPLNDGCTQSNPTLICYANQADCDNDIGGTWTAQNAGACVEAPLNCPWIRSVSN